MHARPQPEGPIVGDVHSLLITARLFLTLEWMLDDWPHLHHRGWGPGFLRGQQQALRDWLAA